MLLDYSARWAILVVIFSLFIVCCSDPIQSNESEEYFYRVRPEETGWSSEKLAEAENFAQSINAAAVIAVHDGKVFFSYGDVSRNYLAHSIRKPLFGSVLGIHVNSGEINLNSTLNDLEIDDIPPVLTEAEKEATIRELLQSRSGVYHTAAAETEAMENERPVRGSHAHGTFYYYNNWDFNALGTIFRQETDLDIFDEFNYEIAEPIGMQDFDPSNCFYQYEYGKSNHPAYHFRISARDLARFGCLYLNSGRWLDRQIVPESWISESTTPYSLVDSVTGIRYGYLWRIIPPGSVGAQLFGYSGYYHTGLGVHLLAVIPEIKLVYVFRVNTDDPNWIDPGEASLTLFKMIMEAKI